MAIQNGAEVLDNLSDWMLPPASARDERPISVFSSAEHALAFLKALHRRAERERPAAA